jgi:hypothetical protein
MTVLKFFDDFEEAWITEAEARIKIKKVFEFIRWLEYTTLPGSCNNCKWDWNPNDSSIEFLHSCPLGNCCPNFDPLGITRATILNNKKILCHYEKIVSHFQKKYNKTT